MNQIAQDVAVPQEKRPASAVSHGVGIVGLIGLAVWTIVARHFGMDGPYAGMASVFAAGIPMLLWSLLVDKVHLRPSTGIDWSNPRPRRETVDVSFLKLAGLWLTWAVIAFCYCVGRWYWDGDYLFAMKMLAASAPLLFALSIPYIFWLDRYLIEPRDGAYALGKWLVRGQDEPADREKIISHARSWAVKGFFLAFMISITPGNFAAIVNWNVTGLLSNPVALAGFLVGIMFMIDVSFATFGYIVTARPLDAHIRSANPYMSGWVAALICYPPFVLMTDGGPLDYRQGSAEWDYWLAGYPVLLWIMGAILVVLSGIYAWATVAFGLRFSNLTHRGILTHGPYAWSKHPAYLSKNLFWWFSSLPFLASSHNINDAVRNTVVLGLVSAVYYWRARTEERHLSADPDYVAYAAWMERNAPVPRFFNWLGDLNRRRWSGPTGA